MKRKKASASPKSSTAPSPQQARPNLGGRPPLFSSIEELELGVREYVTVTMETRALPTKAGLSFHLGMSRDSLNVYEKKQGFSDVLKLYYAFFEDSWIQNLKRPNATGTIFYLKNTFGWVDKHESDILSGGKQIQYVVPQEIAAKHQIVFVDRAPDAIPEEPTANATQEVHIDSAQPQDGQGDSQGS